ncbi:hypothetical protein SGPA1_40313 [Streptomyces misionensis JCM 4497]
MVPRPPSTSPRGHDRRHPIAPVRENGIERPGRGP